MVTFSKLSSDDSNAPQIYFVRIDLGQEEAKASGNRYVYYDTPTKLAKMMNCSRTKVAEFTAGRRTIPFTEWMAFNSSPRV